MNEAFNASVFFSAFGALAFLDAVFFLVVVVFLVVFLFCAMRKTLVNRFPS